MKRVLVIYYTQSGQLLRATEATLKNFVPEQNVKVDYVALKPAVVFPFPWTYMRFFDAFAETVAAIPCELQPVSIDTSVDYDLVILGYQPWFLSISRPMESFLQTEQATNLLKGKKVITILACRNMWLNAQEKMKAHMKRTGADLIGNIAYVDRSSNLTSLVTVLAFELGGVQGKFLGIFPKYGVSEKELQTKAWHYGDVINRHLQSGKFEQLQEQLNAAGAITIKPNLMIMEGRGKVLFPLYSKFILKNGSSGRKTRVRIFGIALPLLILLLSPLITLVSRLLPYLIPAKINALKAYHSSNAYHDATH